MLLNNYAIRNANQSRALGGNLDPTYSYNLNRMYTFYVGANNVVDVTDRMSIPAEGYRPPYSLVLAPKAGGMSMYTAGDGEVSATGVMGMFTTADLAGIGQITNAAMGLTVEMIATLAGTGSLTASVIGALEASATLNGSGSLTGDIGALAGMVADLLGSGTLTGTEVALGLMEAAIYVNQSQATVDQIVTGVVDNLGTITATVPNLLNTETGDVIIPLS